MKPFKMKSLFLISVAAGFALVFGFQNCSPARFIEAGVPLDQRSLGDDGQVAGTQPGDDGNTPHGQPGNDGQTSQDTFGYESTNRELCDARYAEVVSHHTPQSLCASATTVRFMAGQHYYVGDISIAAKNGHLDVQIALMGNVVMRESHLDLANSPEALQTSPGEFKYKMTHNPLASQYTYSIPLAEANLVVGQTIYARIHAVVGPGENSMLCGGQTAWAEGITDGVGWAMYVPITISECQE